MCRVLAKAVVQHSIDLSHVRLTLFHCKALGFFLAHSSCCWRELQFPFHGLSDQYLLSFCESCSEATSTGSSIEKAIFCSTAYKRFVSLNKFSQNVTHLISSAAIFQNCKAISLSYSSLESATENAIVNVVSLKRLQSVSLSRNLNEPDVNYEKFVKISKNLEVTKSLKVLNLHHCGIDSNSAQLLSSALKVNSSIEELTLCFNNIRSDGSFHLFTALTSNSNIKVLDLTGNLGLIKGLVAAATPVLNPALEALEDMLSFNTSLEVLNLNGCELEGIAVESIARGLAFNCTLKSLQVGLIHDPKSGMLGAPEYVGILAATNIIKALQVNSSLKNLSLSFRFDLEVGFSEVLGRSIRKMLIENKSLEKLTLSVFTDGDPPIISFCNRLTYLEESIAFGLEVNCTLTELLFHGQLFTPSACEKLFLSLHSNTSLTKVAIDAAYYGRIGDSLGNMIKHNKILQVLDMCASNNLLEKANIVSGLELPEDLKTDRGEPDLEPFQQKVSDDVNKHILPDFPEKIKQLKAEYSSQEGQPVVDPSLPLPTIMYSTYSVVSLTAHKYHPVLSPINIFHPSACVNTINALQSNHLLREIYLCFSLDICGGIESILTALTETVSQNPVLKRVKIYSDKSNFQQHHFAEFLKVAELHMKDFELKMKRFGRGDASLYLSDGSILFERNYTELFKKSE